ncbi:hypothetical protein M011DRAFT_92472 [Sporormia fimetaria CBS 119925]|uniref:Uncharacterized protein n=1 Tax=Sporormia fimetaria CBS 119925 TaxID=1340428 RepID=A0A6A6V6K9_9PLEO|nr:hypothetical protein M011DRAFT_92472 [Sporormia fimetaria CBS 119925]
MERMAHQFGQNLPRLVEEGLQQYFRHVSQQLALSQVEERLQLTDLRHPEGRDAEKSKGHPRRLSGQFAAQEEGFDNWSPSVQVIKGAPSEPRPKPRKRAFSKTFPLPTGSLHIRIVRIGANNVAQTLSIQIRLIPFSWLSKRGRIMLLDQDPLLPHGSAWKISLRSYNIVRSDAMIIRACHDADLTAIQSLFQYGEASPYDTDSKGRMLMSHVWRWATLEFGDVEALRGVQRVLRFLATQGADAASCIREILDAYYEYSNPIAAWIGFMGLSPNEEAKLEITDEILRFCIEHSRTDPFEDMNTLLALWNATSLGGVSVAPLDASYLFQDNFVGLDELVFEMPNRVFMDILGGTPYIPNNAACKQIFQRRYEILVYLCRGKPQSIKNKIFSGAHASSVTGRTTSDACFCAENSTHLLFLALRKWSMFRYRGLARARIILKHVHRVLVELLRSGEDPEATCSCETAWQSKPGHRTVSDLAGEEGLFHVWETALEICGRFDAFHVNRILDEWRYLGVAELFDAPLESDLDIPVVEKNAVTTCAPIKLVGSLIYCAISTIY